MNALLVVLIFLAGGALGFITPFLFFPEKVEEWVWRRRMVRTLARRGAYFAEGVRGIGLLAAELEGLDEDQLFDTVIYWLAKTESFATRWHAAHALFGRSLANAALEMAEKRHGRAK